MSTPYQAIQADNWLGSPARRNALGPNIGFDGSSPCPATLDVQLSTEWGAVNCGGCYSVSGPKSYEYTTWSPPTGQTFKVPQVVADSGASESTSPVDPYAGPVVGCRYQGEFDQGVSIYAIQKEYPSTNDCTLLALESTNDNTYQAIAFDVRLYSDAAWRTEQGITSAIAPYADVFLRIGSGTQGQAGNNELTLGQWRDGHTVAFDTAAHVYDRPLALDDQQNFPCSPSIPVDYTDADAPDAEFAVVGANRLLVLSPPAWMVARAMAVRELDAATAAAARGEGGYGLGTTIKRLTAALGVQPCDGCLRRAAGLDRLTAPMYRRLGLAPVIL